MKKIKGNIRSLLVLVVFLFSSVPFVFGQAPNDIPNMIGGDYWHSILPPSHVKTGLTTQSTSGQGYMRLGTNLSKTWNNPNGHYPNAYFYTGYWVGTPGFIVYDPDTTFCPEYINNKANPYYKTNSAPSAKNFYNHFTPGIYHPLLDGVNDPTRTYIKVPYWVNPTTRHSLVSEFGYVTNVGIDVKVRLRQFEGPNWNNLNDYLFFEWSFKNTGNVDINHDGIFEKTNHKITGLAFNFNDGGWNPHTGTQSGTRGNYFTTSNDSRVSGWVGDLDPNNEPWATIVGFVGCGKRYNPYATPPAIPSTGVIDMGFGPYGLKYYSDIWEGFTVIAAKKGGLNSDVSKGTVKNEDKPLLWGTPAIGTGAQRGWFLSAGVDKTFGFDPGTPKQTFLTTIGVYCKDGGVSGLASSLNYNPDPNFFASGQAEMIDTWVPKKTTGITAAERPRGDRKSLSLTLSNPANAFYQLVEDGVKEGTTKYTPSTSGNYPAWGHMGAEGVIDWNNYDASDYTGVGPFSLEVGEEITVTVAMYAGFRLEGLQKSLRAARWAYEQDFQIPEPPPVPNMDVKSTIIPSALIRWDNVAENDTKFAGYKIWKSSSESKNSYLDAGMRIIDRYQELTKVGGDKTDLKKPINPHFNAFTDVSGSAYKGLYPGDTWGVWELLQIIPKSDLTKYVETNAPTGYKYIMEDPAVALGIKYWYYVSAYSTGSFTGPGGETTTTIETHSINRNGATGLWCGTYPYATSYTYYPTTDQGIKDIGGYITFFTKLAKESELKSGSVKIGVRPNPYREIARHDSFISTYDHKVLFYNLPKKCKITIVDVTGKIVQILNFTENVNETRGSMFWNLFSKDGEEVSSGLYIYYAEYDGGSQTGKFAILR